MSYLLTSPHSFHRYTRNLIDTGNGKFNLMALCWGERHGSSIHDHSDSHCFVKILNGNLKETMYSWPSDRSDDSEMVQQNENIYSRDGVAYINGALINSLAFVPIYSSSYLCILFSFEQIQWAFTVWRIRVIPMLVSQCISTAHHFQRVTRLMSILDTKEKHGSLSGANTAKGLHSLR